MACGAYLSKPFWVWLEVYLAILQLLTTSLLFLNKNSAKQICLFFNVSKHLQQVSVKCSLESVKTFSRQLPYQVIDRKGSDVHIPSKQLT